jgi:hypothetical protein
MNPISPIGAGYSGPAAGLRLTGAPAGGAGSASRASNLILPGTGAAAGLSNVQTALTDLMQSLGLEDDKMLRMMLGLIILMALLQGSGSEGEAGAQAMANLGQQVGNLLYLGFDASYTSLQIEQTTTLTLSTENIQSVMLAQNAGSALGGAYDAFA